MKVFYSWQAWLPGSTNRNFIENAIKLALTQLNTDPETDYEAVMDRDTQGVAGSVAIADTIFQKIRECQIFICDVTFVSQASDDRYLPNPNVLMELGFAVAVLGWERVICVANTAFGSVEQMPFDLKNRRILTYRLHTDDEKAPVRKQLTSALFGAIRDIADRIPSPEEPVTQIERLLVDPANRFELERTFRSQQEATFKRVQTDEFHHNLKTVIAELQKRQPHWHTLLWPSILPIYLTECQQLIEDAITVAWGSADQYVDMFKESLLRFTDEPSQDAQKRSPWRYLPSLFLLYAIGIVAVRKQNWGLLQHALVPGNAELWDDYLPRPFLHVMVHSTFKPYERVRRVIPHESLGTLVEAQLRPLFQVYLPSDRNFWTSFDLFEMLLSLAALKQALQTENNPLLLLPTVAESARDTDRTEEERLQFWEQAGALGERWELLQSGLLGQNSREVQELLRARQAILDERNQYPDVPSRYPRYLEAYELRLR